MTAIERLLAGTVKETISSNPASVKPNAIAARAASVAYPCPVGSREPPADLNAGVKRLSKVGSSKPAYR